MDYDKSEAHQSSRDQGGDHMLYEQQRLTTNCIFTSATAIVPYVAKLREGSRLSYIVLKIPEVAVCTKYEDVFEECNIIQSETELVSGYLV